jgi:SAM-dependent methyltransferase
MSSSLSRSCPVCQTDARKAKLFAKETIDSSKFSDFSFASRKEPEFMSHRLVQCPTCDLVYADSPPDEKKLAQAYHVADYDSADEAEDAADAYIHAIRDTLAMLSRRESALEIGTGTGIFLEHLSRAGFTKLIGVEPSPAAIAAAPERRRQWIRQGMFDEQEFAPASFDLICCFMTMEHVRDPEVVASAAFRLLRPGGAFVTVTHDYRSLVNRLLGMRSPIIDIEHMQLFSKQSIRYLLQRSGYTDVTVKAFINTYAMQYWARLAPIPRIPKRAMTRTMAAIGLDKIKIGFKVGNMIAAGFKSV